MNESDKERNNTEMAAVRKQAQKVTGIIDRQLAKRNPGKQSA
jgi:hypothetical protein